MYKCSIIPEQISKSDQLWLCNCEQLIFEQIKKGQINLIDLSYNLAVSERQLHRKINILIGLTPNKFIRVLRLYKAKDLIENYFYNSVSEVSYAVGYLDTYYFSKLFLQQYEVTPSDMLASLK